MRTLLIVIGAVLLVAALSGCACPPWKAPCDDPYYVHDAGTVCPVCGGEGSIHGRCSRYQTVWRECPYCRER